MVSVNHDDDDPSTPRLLGPSTSGQVDTLMASDQATLVFVHKLSQNGGRGEGKLLHFFYEDTKGC